MGKGKAEERGRRGAEELPCDSSSELPEAAGKSQQMIQAGSKPRWD